MELKLRHKRQGQEGFTLVELAIVMIIIGLIFGSLLSVFKNYILQKREAELIKKTNAITSAMALYVQDEGYITPAITRVFDEAVGAFINIPAGTFIPDENGAQFPCPADPTLGPGDAGFGQEMRTALGPVGTPNRYAGTTCTAPLVGGVYHGAVPFAELDLSADDTLDQYGNKFSYAVSATVSDGEAFMAGRKPLGSISVTKFDTLGGTTTIPNVPFALVHHGASGFGSYSPAGVRLACPAAAAARDADNCNDDATFVDANDFMNTNDASAEFYDDKIVFTLRGLADKEEYWQHGTDTLDVISYSPGNVGIRREDPKARFHVVNNSTSDVNNNVATGGADNSVDGYQGQNAAGVIIPAKNFTMIAEGEGDNSGGLLITSNDIDDDQSALTAWNESLASVVFDVSAQTGATSIAGTLDVALDATMQQNLDVIQTVTANAYLYSSDKRLKENIVDLGGNTLEDLMMMRIIKYNLINGDDSTKIGVIAQNLQEFFPELVHVDKNGMMKVDYIGLVGPIIKGMQELRSEQKEEIDALKSDIEVLKAEIKAIKKGNE